HKGNGKSSGKPDKGGLLSLPLPKNDTHLIKKPLWEYLEEACETRVWQPGKLFIGFNLTGHPLEHSKDGSEHLGQFSHFSEDSAAEKQLQFFSLEGQRKLMPYDFQLHSHRALYFPGHEDNRLLTHFYSYLFFVQAAEDRRMKRFVRDRLRYHDDIFCVASKIIANLIALQGTSSTASPAEVKSIKGVNYPVSRGEQAQYIAFHIRRGDFQQKHTRLPAQDIEALTQHLVPDRAQRVLYIATDEKNRSFFQPFVQAYRQVVFLDDVMHDSGIEQVDANYVGKTMYGTILFEYHVAQPYTVY
ncbi:hypothetical protein EON64_11095, partial [archaeon]